MTERVALSLVEKYERATDALEAGALMNRQQSEKRTERLVNAGKAHQRAYEASLQAEVALHAADARLAKANSALLELQVRMIRARRRSKN